MHQTAQQNEVQTLQARVEALEAEIRHRKEVEARLRRRQFALLGDAAKANAAVDNDHNSHQEPPVHEQHSDQVLIRQTMTLAKTTAMLVEKERLLHAYQKIGQAILAYLDLERILDTLIKEIIHASIFPNLAIALVHQEQRALEVVRAVTHPHTTQPHSQDTPTRLPGIGEVFALDGDCAIARAAREGEMIVEQVRFVPDGSTGSENESRAIAFFIPVKRGEQVLAVLETRAPSAEKETLLKRISTMQPLLDQVAVALEHARLYAEAQQQSRQLIGLERLQALGELSLGVSHNLNNLLAEMLVPAQILQESSQDPQVLREADEIVEAGQRAAELVRQLYRSVRVRQEGRLEPLQLNEIVTEIVRAMRLPQAAEGRVDTIEIHTALQDIPPVQGVAFEFGQVLANLLDNAVDALPQGGRITIGTQPHNGGVQLYVRDTGRGMDEETRRRAFEPFFTTKNDVGSGLGLSVVYNTIKLWKGRVDIRSAPGQGTCCTLWLPTWEGPVDEKAVPQELASTRAGRILLVQEDEVLSDVLGEVLGKRHKVEALATCTEALERIVPGRYEVALVDPGAEPAGAEHCGQALRLRDPGLVTILLTRQRLAQSAVRVFDLHLRRPLDIHAVPQTIGLALALYDRRSAELE